MQKELDSMESVESSLPPVFMVTLPWCFYGNVMCKINHKILPKIKLYFSSFKSNNTDICIMTAQLLLGPSKMTYVYNGIRVKLSRIK